MKRLLPRALMRAYEAECRKETHINRALERFGPEARYLEIGVRDGSCLAQIRARHRAGVDPKPVNPEQIERDGARLFIETSDAFFDRSAGGWLDGHRIDVAFVDGLHEFEQALRDLLHLEPLMAPDGIVFLHDCNPPTRRHQDDRNFTWNGDVWKIFPYLAENRPDLRFFTLDCDWGLGVVTGFAAEPPEARAEAVAQSGALDYTALERDRSSLLNLKHPLYSRYYFARKRVAALQPIQPGTVRRIRNTFSATVRGWTACAPWPSGWSWSNTSAATWPDSSCPGTTASTCSSSSADS